MLGLYFVWLLKILDSAETEKIFYFSGFKFFYCLFFLFISFFLSIITLYPRKHWYPFNKRGFFLDLFTVKKKKRKEKKNSEAFFKFIIFCFRCSFKERILSDKNFSWQRENTTLKKRISQNGIFCWIHLTFFEVR